jgi:para-nitrobenzyl esterase
VSGFQCGGSARRLCRFSVSEVRLLSNFVPSGSVRRLLALLAVPVLVLSGCGDSNAGDAPAPSPDAALSSGVVRTEAGAVRGQVAPEYVLFQGIPYAAPPVGELRFEPPAPVPAWDGMRDATKPGPRCVQDASQNPDMRDGMSEDCLSVNVWTPAAAAGLPVMVWIHGGSFTSGSAELYNAQWLATKGRMVVVTVNYRLGSLGFLAHPGFGPPEQVGNYGLADQQAALRWVRDNIEGFGGDPAKVTVSGESAGGMSVCDHLVAPESEGLFRAAIIMSGPCQAQLDATAGRDNSLDYATAVGCPDPGTAPRCLRDLPATALEPPLWYYQIGADGLSGPLTGTDALPVDPMQSFAKGEAAQVPVLIGSTRDEFTLFVALQYLKYGRESSPDEYPGLLADTFGADAQAVGERYPLTNYGGSVSLAYSAAVTDGDFACVADQMAHDFAAGDAPVYAYEFTDRTAPAPEPLTQLPFPAGASHSLELRYLFDVGGAPALDPVQQKLSDQMIGYFSEFVATGAPSAPDAPEWPEFDGEADGARMSFDADGSRIGSGFDQEHQCAFWAGLQDR